jgi:lipopolysaccharide/colanic/teichoic acid biosynthesis glycosyltransferase
LRRGAIEHLDPSTGPGGAMTGNSRQPRLAALTQQPISRRSTDTVGALRVTRYQRWAKPVIDRVVGCLLCVAATPLLATIGLAVYLTLGRPVLLRQRRIGHRGREFALYKFRTMLPDRRAEGDGHAGPERRTTHKHPNDPRHTPLGRMLRRYSLDEFPQLLNVACGDMSLIGPRPELPQIVAGYEPWEHARHSVKPGLSGLWQVTERGNGLMHQHIQVDLDYAGNVTLRGDLWILGRTIPTLLGRNCAGS